MSEKNLQKIFQLACKKAPSILCFDEIESLTPSRFEVQETAHKLVSIFLQNMDGLKKLENVLVIGTTNYPQKIDSALLRPGRFDIKIEIPLPEKNDIIEILKIHLKNKPIKEINYKIISQKASDYKFSGAHVFESVNTALREKAIEELYNKEPGKVSTDDILMAIEMVNKREIKLQKVFHKENNLYS